MKKPFNKITTGFVIQKYDKTGKCVSQEFVCGDDVTFKTLNGEAYPKHPKETYQPFEMVQPYAS